jgi:hypothetical protein
MKPRFLIVAMLASMVCTTACFAAQLQLPDKVIAGQGLTLRTSGSGDATLYIDGPGTAIKREIKLGEEVQIKGEELHSSGYYIVAVKAGDGDSNKELYVAPAAAEKINFLARPSRVPVAQPKVIDGTAFVFDQYENLVTAPTPVTFELSVPGASAKVVRITSKEGVAYLQTDSGSKAGPGQFVATVGNNSVRRVVEETASEPCNLRFNVHKEREGLVAQTDPVRDCSGNPVPDGTIVTFMSNEPGSGRSTVDARVKKGVARAILPPVPGATISVASGVVLGNEIRWGGGL